MDCVQWPISFTKQKPIVLIPVGYYTTKNTDLTKY